MSIATLLVLATALLLFPAWSTADGAPSQAQWHQQRRAERRAAPPVDQAPSCIFYRFMYDLVECYYLRADDMGLLEQALLDASRQVVSFSVDVSYSQGDAIPDDLFSPYNLTYLEMYGNNFSAVPYPLLSSVNSPISSLSISGENFAGVATTATDLYLPFSEYVSELYIPQNAFTGLDLATFMQYSRLKQLVLMENNLESVGLQLLGLDSLQELYLEQNAISSIETGAFRDLANLQLLYLGNNRLSSLQEGAFLGLEESPITIISIAGNPWNCTCELQWLKDWLNVRNLSESSGAECAQPEVAPFNDVNFC